MRVLPYSLKRSLVVFLMVLPLLSSCSTLGRMPEKIQKDFCKIMDTKSGWFKRLMKIRKSYPESHPWIIIAFMHQESRFYPHAVPKGSKAPKKGDVDEFKPAYGYAQAIKTTWDAYRKATGNENHERHVFAHAAEFIAWYNTVSVTKVGIDDRDAESLYLAYHEGHGGFKRKTFNLPSHKWIKKVAKKVNKQSERYRKQFRKCNGK